MRSFHNTICTSGCALPAFYVVRDSSRPDDSCYKYLCSKLTDLNVVGTDRLCRMNGPH